MRENPDAGRLFDPTVLTTAMRGEEHKLVHTPDWSRLYEVPDERTDVSEASPEVYAELRERLDEWFESEGQPFEEEPEEADLSEEVEEQLRGWGYLE